MTVLNGPVVSFTELSQKAQYVFIWEEWLLLFGSTMEWLFHVARSFFLSALAIFSCF
jgi:hypothetical protein